MTSSQPSSSQTSSAQPSGPTSDPAALWSSARRLHPIYAQLAREFVIDSPACVDLETAVDTPESDSVERALQWLNDMDEKIQVHQLRQFLQNSSLLDSEALVILVQHFLAKTTKTVSVRDKVDFLLVQYFSQSSPTELDDSGADLAYVAQGLEPVLGKVELKAPVWLNALDRTLDGARHCRSLDELLHGGVLDQGRKAKMQAGDLFYLPIALVAFTRFGYLMRRIFFRLMLADLNSILDGLTELEKEGVETIDCRRAQFSEQEPIIRLRMICQSWKVMFQAEYSSGQPLRMLVDLKASVDAALSPGSAARADKKGARTASQHAKPRAAAAAAGAGGNATSPERGEGHQSLTRSAAPDADGREFEISATPQEWNPDADSQPDEKK